jgi:hypothetical protein
MAPAVRCAQVGFYQVCKVLITPTLLFVEFVWLRKRPGRAALLSTAVLLAGISIATLLDKQASAGRRAGAGGGTRLAQACVHQPSCGLLGKWSSS